MRNIPLLIICSILITCGIVSYAQTGAQEESDLAAQDSTIDVIGYFLKNDTLIYWINQSNWSLSPTDTIKTAGVSTKVRLTVVDSTSTGYKMDYTFLEVRGDSTVYSSSDNYQNIMNTLVEKSRKKIVGTTIHFETNELGEITRINNLGKIKRNAKSLFNETMKEILQIPEIAVLKNECGIDLKEIVKDVDIDKLVDGYLEDLELIFLCHGNVYTIGRSHIHEDATATTYGSDTYSTVTVDSADYSYSIATEVINTIPRSTIKNILGGVVELMNNDSVAQSFDKEFDTQVNEDVIHDSYISYDFMEDGWPYRIVNQTTTTVGGHGKSSQTYIYLDDIN